MVAEGVEKLVNSKSKTFFAFCFCFLVGVALASGFEWEIKFIYLEILLFALAALAIFYWDNRKSRALFLAIFFLTAGLARYSLALPESGENVINHYNGRVTTISGVVASEPDVRLDSVRYVVRARKIVNLDKEVEGKIYLTNPLYPRFNYGDELKFTCELKSPKPRNDGEKVFRYDRYLAIKDVFSVCGYAKIEKISGGNGSRIYAGILEIKAKLADKIIRLWHEPHAGFMAGLLYGYRGGLGKLNEDFTRTGVTHIVAISGYNITIIAALLIFLLVRMRIRRQIAFWIIASLIVLFVIFTGAGASVMRAGIMGILVLLARQAGRAAKAGNMLIFAAAVMVAQSPFILLYDAGFQLSFISTLGLIYLNPVIAKYAAGMPELFGLKESALSTISAIIATMPIILYQFGRLSLVAPVVNLLILWLVPFLMALGAASAVAGFVYLPLARILAAVAWLGLEYIIRVVHWFAGLSFASMEIAFPFWLTFLGYCGMIYFIKSKTRDLKIKTEAGSDS